MKNKEQLAKDYCQSWRGDYVAWAAAESGFIAGWEAHQQLLQQTRCTTHVFCGTCNELLIKQEGREYCTSCRKYL